MAGPLKTYGRVFGKWYIPSHVKNRYKERVPDPQIERRTGADIERIITKALHGVDRKSLKSLPMIDGAYVYEAYFRPKGRPLGPFYLLLQERSVREPDKPAVISVWTEEMYRERLGTLTATSE